MFTSDFPTQTSIQFGDIPSAMFDYQRVNMFQKQTTHLITARWYTYPSGKHESQLGWWNSQYFPIYGKSTSCSSHHQADPESLTHDGAQSQWRDVASTKTHGVSRCWVHCQPDLPTFTWRLVTISCFVVLISYLNHVLNYQANMKMHQNGDLLGWVEAFFVIPCHTPSKTWIRPPLQRGLPSISKYIPVTLFFTAPQIGSTSIMRPALVPVSVYSLLVDPIPFGIFGKPDFRHPTVAKLWFLIVWNCLLTVAKT